MILSTSTALFFVISVLFSNFLVTFLQKLWKTYTVTRKLQLPANFQCDFLLGHAKHLLGEDCSQKIVQILLSFGKDPGVLWFGFEPHFIINDPAQIEKILLHPACLNKPPTLDKFDVGSGTGLLFAKNEIWKKHRKILNPVFSQKMITGYMNIFLKYNEALCKKLEPLTNGQVFDMAYYVERYYFDLFFECSMGETATKIRKEYFKVSEKYFRLTTARNYKIYYKLPFVYQFSKLKRDMDNYKRRIMLLCDQIYQNRLKLFKKPDEISEDSQNYQMIFLDHLIDLSLQEGLLNKNEILDEVAVFISAGVETCAIVFPFVCLMLGMHPEIQEKVYQEILNVLGEEGEIKENELSKLNYMEQVIKETIRLFPVGLVLPREPVEDIKIDGYLFPKGSHLSLNVINLHRSELNFESPLEFRPERFDPEHFKNMNKFSYLPFSAGPRTCIGRKFGMWSLKTSVATFLRHFRIETIYPDVASVQIEHVLTIKAVQGFPIRIFSRTD